MADLPQITVIICTWNRAALLDQTLTHLRALRIPKGVSWELLVVNNCCSDDTDRVIQRHLEALPIRRLFEPKPGLSNARNCAIDAARGELIIWTDDDVIVDQDWLSEYWAAYIAWPDASFFGGTIKPLYEQDPPRWIRRHERLLAGPFAIRQFGEHVGPLREGELPFGASMAFPRRVLTDHRFDPSLGRTGAHLLSGEESAVLAALRRQGRRGVWVGTARLQHWIPNERTTWRYLWRWFVADGRSAARAMASKGKTFFGLPRWAIRALLQSAAGTVIGGRGRVAHWRKLAFTTGLLLESRTIAVTSLELPASVSKHAQVLP